MWVHAWLYLVIDVDTFEPEISIVSDCMYVVMYVAASVHGCMLSVLSDVLIPCMCAECAVFTLQI